MRGEGDCRFVGIGLKELGTKFGEVDFGGVGATVGICFTLKERGVRCGVKVGKGGRKIEGDAKIIVGRGFRD